MNTRRWTLTIGFLLAGVLLCVAAGYQTKVYVEQGGARQVIASSGSLDVESGGEIDIESGGALKIAGTQITPSAAQFNYLAGVTPGTVTASKAVVVNATKQQDVLITTGAATIGTDITVAGGDVIGLTSTNIDMGEAASGVIALTAASGVTTSAGLTTAGDVTISGGDLIGLTSTNIDLGEANTGVMAITAANGVTTSGGLTTTGDVTITGGDLVGLTTTNIDLGDASAGVVAITAATGVTTSAALTVGTDLTITGGDITGAGSTAIDMGEANTGVVAITAANGVTTTGGIAAVGTVQGEHLTSTDDATITDDLTVGGDLAVTGASEFTGDITSGNIATATGTVSAEHLTSTDDATIADDLTLTAGDLIMQTFVQPVMVYTAAFDIEEATMDADDGTGIKIAGVTLNLAGKVLRAYLDVTQGYNEVSDTIELIINDTDDATTPVTTLVAATDCSAASMLAFNPATSTSVPLATVSTTNKYVLALYKDVGNDGSAAANLQGRLYVEYITP